MNYCKIKDCDIADGLGVRVSLFVSGCTNHCKGCFQPETWDFDYGKEFTKDIEDEIIKLMNKDYINGLTLLGGDPFEPRNQYVIYNLLKRVKNELSEKNIWAYTGFLYEDILNNEKYPHTEYSKRILEMIDILVDGKFEESLHSPALKFRGSSNQRIIQVKESLKENKVILLPIKDRVYIV